MLRRRRHVQLCMHCVLYMHIHILHDIHYILYNIDVCISLSLYIYIYMYVCVYYICTHIYTHVYIVVLYNVVCMYVCIHIYIYTYIHYYYYCYYCYREVADPYMVQAHSSYAVAVYACFRFSLGGIWL